MTKHLLYCMYVAVAFFLEPAHGEKAVIDPMVWAEELCQADAGKAKPERPIEAELIDKLIEHYGLKPNPKDWNMSFRDAVEAKLFLECERNPESNEEDDKGICARQLDYPLDVLFADNKNALRFRKSLLRMIHDIGTSPTGAVTRGDAVAKFGEEGADLFRRYPVRDSVNLEPGDTKWLRKVIYDVHVRASENPGPPAELKYKPTALIQVTCGASREPAASPRIAGGVDKAFRDAGQKLIGSSTQASDGALGPWKFQVAKDADQFFEAEPEGAELGTKFGGDTDSSDLKADIALGWVTTRKLEKAKTEPWKSPCATESRLACTQGSRSQISLFASYSQEPGTYKVLDPKGATYPDGKPVLVDEEFASGRLAFGARYDIEALPPFTHPAIPPAGVRQELIGRRRPGHRTSLVLETFTDNYFDLQGNRAEITYSPPGAWIGDLPGYRRQSLVFDSALNAAFKWDVDVVLDYIYYARQPKNRDALADSPRLDLRDFIRVGYDLEAEVSGRLPFGVQNDPAWWVLGGKRVARESTNHTDADAAYYEYSLFLKNIVDEKWDVGVTYHDGRDPFDFQTSKYWSLDLSWKQ